MIEPIAPIRWLFQPITMPLAGFLVAVLLPAGYLSKLARKKVSERFGLNEG